METMFDKEKNRCFWANPNNPLYIAYHDDEWGVPCHDERMLFEMLILEGFQAGLSWECVLNKREAFREAFDKFDVQKVACYDESKLTELAANPEIIRNRSKINASVINARAFIEIQEEYGSFDRYIWSFTDGRVIYEPCDLQTTSPLSDRISKDLKKRGMKFVGSTIIYSYLQAIGVINGHLENCWKYQATERIMTIRKATLEDIPRMQEIFAIARKFMAETGNPNQWADTYPSVEQLTEDINRGDSYVCQEEGKLVATFVLRGGNDPTYDMIYDGAWKNDNPYATIHRIASNGEVKGIFNIVMDYALQHYDTIRIDTHRDNKVMQNAIAKAGFEYCGIIHCWNDDERLAYQYN